MNFYQNPHIQKLSNKPRWTVSDKNKRPLDMRAFLENSNNIYGAKYTDDRCLVTLGELNNAGYNFANNAFFLNSLLDSYAILDIEPTCEETMKQKLLSLPHLYSETSMSGKGYHLLMPLPKNFNDFPLATQKTKLQDKSKGFEILLNHWVTFTRNPIPDGILPPLPMTSWEEVYADLAKEAKEPIILSFDINETKPDIPEETTIIELMKLMYSSRDATNKTLGDFNSDHSRYEFSVLGSLYHHLEQIIIATQFAKYSYDVNQKSWLVFLAAKDLIPKRAKHDEYRNGVPLLLNAASHIVSSNA